jgi:hypothetical protein
MDKQIYKVVRKEGDKYYSVYADGLAKTEYIPNRWVFPPEPFVSYGYGIYGFLYLNSATIFYETLREPAEIWLCDAINVRTVNKPRFSYPLANIKTLEDLRNRMKEAICGLSSFVDEVFCDSVRLIRPINPFETLKVPAEILERYTVRKDLTWADFAKIIQDEQRPWWIKEIYRLSDIYNIPMIIFKYLASIFCPACGEIRVCNHWDWEDEVYVFSKKGDEL